MAKRSDKMTVVLGLPSLIIDIRHSSKYVFSPAPTFYLPLLPLCAAHASNHQHSLGDTTIVSHHHVALTKDGQSHCAIVQQRNYIKKPEGSLIH